MQKSYEGTQASPSLNAGKQQLLLDQKIEASNITAGGKRRKKRKTRHGGKAETMVAPYNANASNADNARSAEMAATLSNIERMNDATAAGGGRRRRKTKSKRKGKRKRKTKRVTKSKKRRRRSRKH